MKTFRITLVVLGAMLVGLVASGPARAQSEEGSVDGGRAWLGVRLQVVTPELAEALKLGGEHGALVSEVKDGSPADQAGIEDGDVIVRIGDHAVDRPDDAVRAIGQLDPGGSVEISIVREGSKLTRTARLAPEPAAPARLRRPRMARERGQEPDAQPRSFLGVRTEELDEDLAAYFGTTRGRGVLVTHVLSDSPAEKAGLRSGDVILQVGSDRVEDPEGLLGTIGKRAPGERVELKILRQHREKDVSVSLEDAPARPQPDQDWFGSFRNSMRDFGGRLGSDRREMNARVRDEIDKLKEEVENLRREIEELKRKGS